MGTLTDTIAQAGQIDSREQAIIDRNKKGARKGALFQDIAEGMAEIEIDTRRQQRAYAEKPPTPLAQMTVDPAREMISNLGDRAKVLDTIRKISPQQRQEALKLIPGIAQQLGDDRGGAVGRTLGAVSRGISGVSQPIQELAGQVTGTDWGGNADEIAYIRQLENAASQEFSPARPGDPWYQAGPLQATEMLPWMATVVGGAGLGRAVATNVAGRVAAGAAAGGKVAGALQGAGQAVSKLPQAAAAKIGLKGVPAVTAGKVGELAGITAAAFPSQYAQEVDSLKALGMVDNTRLRLLAGGTAAITGLVEGIVPNPFKAGGVSVSDGAVKAARQYLWNAAKNAPGELTEEYLQGVTSGLGEHVAQYIGTEVNGVNPAKKKTLEDAFRKGWDQTKEAALPMAFLLGVPAIGGAGMAAARARQGGQTLTEPQLPSATSSDINPPPLPSQPQIRDTASQNTPPQLPPSQPPVRDTMSQNPNQPVPVEPADPVMKDLTPEAIQRLGELDEPPKAHKYADVVHGDRRRFKEAPKPEVIIQQWEKARAAVTGVGTQYAQEGATPSESETAAFIARRKAERSGVKPPPLPEQQPTVLPTPGPVSDTVSQNDQPVETDAIGERTKIADTPVVRSGSFTDEDNIRYELFEAEDGKSGIVRSMDMDSGNVVAITKHPSISSAKDAFGKAQGTKQQVGQATTQPPEIRDTMSQNPPAATQVDPQPEVTSSDKPASQLPFLTPEWRANREKEIASKQSAPNGEKQRAAREAGVKKQVDEEIALMERYPPGTELEVSGLPASKLKVLPDGRMQSTEATSTRIIGDNTGSVLRGYKPEQIKVVSTPKVESLPAESVEGDAPSDKPNRKVYQGRGATPQQVYGEEAVKQGRAVPLLGAAQYYAFNQQDASAYGNVTELDEPKVKNTLVLRNDTQWKDLLSNAKTPHLNNMSREFNTEPAEIAGATERMQNYLKSQGYDSVRVELPEGEQNKRLRETFGHEQLVVFSDEIRQKRPLKKDVAPESKNSDTVSQNPKPEPKKGGDPSGKVETEGQTKAQTKTEAQADADGLLGSKVDQATGGAPSSESSVGLTEGFKSLPPHSQAAFEKEWNKEGASIKEILFPTNKNYRAEFEARTGIKLPKTAGGTFEAVEKWNKEGRKLAGDAVSRNGLPSLKEGYSRFVHIGNPGIEQSMKDDGLDYAKQGVIQSTARNWNNESDVEYTSEDPRFANGTAYVFDVPDSEVNQHFSMRNAPGVLSGKHYVGSVPAQEKSKGKKPVAELSKWEQGVTDLLNTVPAFKGASFELSEADQTVKVIRPDGRETTIHFNADEELNRLGEKYGSGGTWRGAYRAKDQGVYAAKGVKHGRKNAGHIFLRSNIDHATTLNHEVVHWLEDEGIITQEEVEKLGGREGVANAYAEWVISKNRSGNTVFARIYEFFERIFDVNAKFFKELTDRVDTSKPKSIQQEFDDAADKALEAILAAEKASKPSKKTGPKEPKVTTPAKTKAGQYILPGMPGMVEEIDRQDFVRKYRNQALEKLRGWSSDPDDAQKIQDAIDAMVPSVSALMNEIYAGKGKDIDEVQDSEAYAKVSSAAGETDMDATILSDLDVSINQAIEDRPKPRTLKKPKKSEETLADAKSDREAAKAAAAALMAKHRSKLTSGVDPELMAETIQVALMYVRAGAKTFKGYVEAILEDFGDAFAREFAPYMESGWKALRKHPDNLVSDDAGKVTDYLSEKNDGNQTKSGTDANPAMEDGVGQPDGNGTTDGDAVDEGRGAQGDSGQKGDRLRQDKEKAGKGDGREGSGGVSTDGNTDADQSEQGQPDAPDSGAGSDAEPVADQRTVNHVIGPDDDIAVASLTESLKRNIKALDILKKLESEGLFPDEAQRKALAQYTGWGGLSQALDSLKGERMLREQEWNRDENWEKKWGPWYRKLKESLSKEDFQAAQDSTENAHYTSKTIIQSLWKIAERLGFDGGRVLELGAGIGHFAGLVPSRVRGQTQFVMVERDNISSRIIKMLYPRHEVVAGDMEKFKAIPGSATIGIGNVPFAGGNVSDSATRYKEDLNLHNYSIARHLDAVAPGGIVVVISTHNTLDSNIKQRKFLASKGELIGAIRLPNDAFAENAKTEVVTDILIFRRPRQGDGVVGVRFDQDSKITVKNKEGKDVVKSINKYFVDNPEMVLGEHSAKGSMREADEYTVNSTAGSLQSKLDAAIEKLPKDLLGKVDITEKISESITTVPFGRLEVRNGKVVMGFDDKFVPIEGKKFEGFPVYLTGSTGVKRAKDYIELRDLLTSVRNVMLNETSSDDAVNRAQVQLGKSYDRYVAKHGPLNSGKTNIFVRDPDFYRVLSLENAKPKYNTETKKIEVTYAKASIFTERVLGPQKEPESAASAADAVSISTAWKGSIDSVYVGKLLGLSPKEAEAKLIEEGLAFRNPTTTELELSDLYLSGNVRSKLEQAKISAAEDPQYEKNVEELTKVMPKDVAIKKDTVRLGAAWIPEHVINAFATQEFGTEVNVSYNANTDSWSVSSLYDVSETAKSKYKTDRVQPELVLSETLNLRSIKVYDRKETGEVDSKGKPKTTQVLNEKETQKAKHSASVLRAAFEKWVLESPEISDSLARIYNDKYNNFVRTKYNGDFLVLPGANPEVKLRPYQKDAIWRIINRGTALLAHAVGSGKTYTMIGAAMEMRRLGLARRPLLVVQNATLGQFATSFQKMYPNANVLVASKDDLGVGKRQLFLNKVSTGNWDAVVMAQSTFDNMASDPEVERAFIQDQLDLLEEAIREEGGENAKTPTVKQLVRTKKSLKNRFDSLMGSRAKKSDNVTFEDMGADALFLDEAHAYKKPTFTTKLSNLVGLNVEASARSLATTIKVRSVQSAHNGRNVVLATGTPVTNTLGEAWHMVNYVSPATNAAFSSRTFDQFIGNFAQVEPTLTMNAGGQYVYKDAIVKFRNGRQLVEYINDSWDIVTPDALRAYMTESGTGFPVLRDGTLTAVTVDRTPGVVAFMDYISRVYKRFKDLPAKERREMSFIPAIAYGASKAATLDIRMVIPGASEEKNSKLQEAADNIKRIYDESSETKGTQLFFSDMKNPFNTNRLTQFMGGESIDAFEEDNADSDTEEDSVADDNESGSFLYQEIKKKLLARGIPAEQIAFVAEAKTDKQRQALFERVKNGDIRILIGSTAKMGVGVNVQDKLVALHHFDTPWLPADAEQREGRILRFGNENAEVEILRYAMKKTLDGAIYMSTARKQKFVWQVLNGNLDGDSFDDPSSASMLSIEEQLAAIQDDPVFFEKIEVQNRLRELELERQSFFDAQRRVSSSLSQAKNNLDYNVRMTIPLQEERVKRVEKYKADGVLDTFSMEYEGEKFTDAKKAAELIKEKVEELRKYVMKNFDNLQNIWKAGGVLSLSEEQKVNFKIGPANVTIGAGPQFLNEYVDGKSVTRSAAEIKTIVYLGEPLGRTYETYSGTATVPSTLFEKMETLPEDVQRELSRSLSSVEKYREQIKELESLTGKEWEDQAEYDAKKIRLSEIETQMLASGGSLSSGPAKGKAEDKTEEEQKLDDEIKNIPPDVMYQTDDVNPSMQLQATDVALAAEDAGIKTFDQLVAYSVKTVGERRTREIGGILRVTAKSLGFSDIRPVGDILGVPGVTREQAVTVAKAAFGDQLSDEEVSAGIDVVERLGLLDKIGFAPFGSQVPEKSLNQRALQTDTPEFKKWFGDSKVVGEDGKPLVVYHGTNNVFETFDLDNKSKMDPGWLGLGSYFTDSSETANSYVRIRPPGLSDNVMAVYLSIRNPLLITADFGTSKTQAMAKLLGVNNIRTRNAETRDDAELLRDAAVAKGYDGVVYQYTHGKKEKEYVVFDPKNIKSATGNQGTFDPSNPNILMQNQTQGGNVKGWTSFISATRAIIGATNKADVSTFIHEIAHPMRRFLLNREVPQSKRADITDAEILSLENVLGVKDGDWKVEHEERFAKMWERYWFEGKPPKNASPELQSLFGKIAQWMSGIYKAVQQISKPLPKEVRDLFDKLVQRNGDGGFRDTVSQNENRDTVSQKGDPEITSIKNAIVNELRARRGVPGLEDSASQSQEEWLEAAHDILQGDPNYGDRIVKELNARARNLSPIEIAAMQIYYGMINNRLKKAEVRLAAAKASGDPVESANALMDNDILMNTLWEMETANKAAGSEWSRSGTARQIELDEDFSLVGVMRKARIANAGDALSDKQQDEMRELARRNAELEGLLAKESQEKLDDQRRRNVEDQIEDSKGKVQPVPESIRKKVSDKVNAFKSKFASAFASSKKTENLFATEDEDMTDDARSVIQEYVDTMGVSSLGELLSNLRKDLGSDIPVSVQAAFTTAWKDMKDSGDIPVPTVDKNNVRGLSRLAKQIERSLVEAGITKLDEVVQGVHESLQEIIPDITPRETMDAMSGYGQYSAPSENPDDKIIADINGRLLELAKLDDMNAGIAPARTGVGRQEKSDEHRELIRKVNLAKREGNYRVTDPDTQLKTAVGSAITALTNRIHDLNKAIRRQTPIVSGAKTDLAGQDNRVVAMRKERDDLTAIYKTLFPKPGATREQRIAATSRALDRVANSLEKQIETRNFETKKKAEPISTKELDAKRARIDALRAQREDIAEYKEWNEERKSKAYKANLLKQIADYKDRALHGFYGPKPKKEVRKLSPEEVAIGLELQKIRDEFFRLAGLYRLENMSPREKAWDYTKETAHLSRALMTSADFSAVFRQGGAIAFAHPRMAAETIAEMYRAMRSEATAFELAGNIRNDEMYQFAMTAGLSITEDEGKITKQEEAYMGRWARLGIGAPGTKLATGSKALLSPIAASARGYMAFLNGIRFKLFKHMVATLGKGGQVTADEAAVIAMYINAATGRSELGPMMKWAEQANMLFFAPRFVASRFQYLGMPLWLLGSKKVSGRVKKAIAMEYIRHSAGVGSFLALTVALGALLGGDDEEEKPTVSLDPRSSDFLKIRLGETRIDPMSGLSQVIVLMGRIRYGQRVEADGDVVDLRGEKVPYGGLGMAGTIGNFVRTKFAPVPGAAFDIATGENVVGQDVTPFSSIVNLFIPLSLREIKDTAESRGIPQGALIALLSLHGMGSSTYGPESNYRKGTPEIREKQFKKDIRKMTFDSKDPKYKSLLNEEQMAQVEERREDRKQGLVFSAAANPIRKDFKNDETYAEAVSKRDTAMENLKKSGFTLDESRKLLIKHWESSYGGAKEMRKGVRVYKEALSDRLKRLRKVFEQ